MKRDRRASPQTNAVLQALASRASEWRHGYDLLAETGLKSGTLYPLLARLHDAGLLEAEWRVSPQPGRPARHAYRLTAVGVAKARESAAPSPSPVLAGALA